MLKRGNIIYILPVKYNRNDDFVDNAADKI